MKLYDYLPSGNGYKARLLLAHLGVEYERVELDIVRGESRTREFLDLNLNGRIPVLLLDDGRSIAESNAIQFFLAEGTSFLPANRFDRAKVLEWMFFEQYSHEPYIAVLRHWAHEKLLEEKGEAEVSERTRRGYEALAVMERHLERHAFFAADAFSIADIALYAYTHVADEGGFDLSRYAAVGAWLARVRDQPNHIAIDRPT